MKNKLNGIQYLNFIKFKEAHCELTRPVAFDFDNFEAELAKRRANRNIEEWMQEEIGYRIERTYEAISFFFRITMPDFFRRGKRGWGNSDTWNLDGYLSDVIKGSVLHLEKHIHGYPCGLKSMRQWSSVLKKIAWTFEVAKKIGDEWLYIPSKEHTRKHYNAIKKQFKSCKHLHIMTKTESLKYEEGWKLFQEYYQNLWD